MTAEGGLRGFLSDYTSSIVTALEVKPKTTLEPNVWKEVRVFLSSSFIDTHGERDIILKNVFPELNRRLSSKFIRIVPVDLRWGVLAEESQNCQAIQRTCLNQLDACRDVDGETAWFIGLRTHRYGWVQDQYEDPKRFNKPENFDWLEKLNTSGNQVSITSLECLHAILGATAQSPKPKVFFYERKLTNPEDVEPHLAWIFQYENLADKSHLDYKLKLQYNKTPHAKKYEDDREALNEFLRSQHGVTTTYRDYNCAYEAGNAQVTGTNADGKMFGIGRVGKLDDFAKQIEEDLYESIMANMEPGGSPDMKNIEKINFPFEQPIKEKAQGFIGREDLLKECVEFCEGSTESSRKSNLLILHGEPGCGKSSLTAGLCFSKYLQELREKGNFVFTHAVDTCPGSTDLPSMLRRLHKNLQDVIRESYRCDTLRDLKMNHIEYLEQIARNNYRSFVIVIDAVNQFTPNFKAHLMWWVRLRDPPANLRIIISTLNEENQTFANATKVCPNAIKIPIPDMENTDASLIVTNILKKYNKKLTTTDGGWLGNQMAELLAKSTSPLYLTAATEALRTFGIYEKLSGYIQALPCDIKSLFEKLLNEWEIAYGYEFVRDVCAILCVSKDGILENTINSVLAFIDETERIDYKCSLSSLYEAIRGFLAAGGGGNLRLFHDQLKQVIRQKYLSLESEKARINSHLWKFYVREISPQLCENPSLRPSVEYPEILSRVVFHQLESMGESAVGEDLFESTLRNIYYIRERCAVDQTDNLMQDYLTAINQCNNNDGELVKALKTWKRFANEYIVKYKWYMHKRFGHVSLYNIALQQPPVSYVASDTMKLPEPEHPDYELMWTNPPSSDVMDEVTFSTDECQASPVGIVDGQKMLCSWDETSGFWCLHDIDSGSALHQVYGKDKNAEYENRLEPVHFSPSTKTIWCGHGGSVRVFCVDTGDLLWAETVFCRCPIAWFCEIEGNLFMGSYEVAAFQLGAVSKRVDCWLGEQQFRCCIYNSVSQVVMTCSYDGIAKLWTHKGDLLKEFALEGDVRSLRFHPQHSDLVAIGKDQSIVIYNTATEADELIIPDVDGEIPEFSENGDLFTCSVDRNTILIFNGNGKLINKIQAYSGPQYGGISSISVVPGGNQVIHAGRTGCKLLEVPAISDDVVVEHENFKEDDCVSFCGLLASGKEFFTLDESGTLQIWDAVTSESTRSQKEENWSLYQGDKWQGGNAAAHPKLEVIFTCIGQKMYVVNALLLKTIQTIEFRGKIRDFLSFTPDGNKLVVAVGSVAEVHNIFCSSDNPEQVDSSPQPDDVLNKLQVELTEVKHSLNGDIRCCDIHTDNVQVVSGGKGVDLWDINTGRNLKTLINHRNMSSNDSMSQAKIVYTPVEGVLLCNGNSIDLVNMQGSNVWRFRQGSCGAGYYFLHSELHFISGSGMEENRELCVHDMKDGKIVTAFFDHRLAGRFNLFLRCPKFLLAFSDDGKMFKFKIN